MLKLLKYKTHLKRSESQLKIAQCCHLATMYVYYIYAVELFTDDFCIWMQIVTE